MQDKFHKLALKEAAKSPCEKRKVGAIIVDANDIIVGRGHNHNHNPNSAIACELVDGSTNPDVIHAEVAAIADYDLHCNSAEAPLRMYITHAPCENCQKAMDKASIDIGIVVENFMKFDKDKVKYSLVPSIWTKGDGIVITKGAIKYKAENWRKIPKEDLLKYFEAAYRHMLDWRDYMESLPDSSLFDIGEGGMGTHHLMNARVDLGFLLTLTETEEKANEYR